MGCVALFLNTELCYTKGVKLILVVGPHMAQFGLKWARPLK